MTTQQAPESTSTGFDFLVGSWDVSHRRFRDNAADEFRGTAAAWTHLGGAVSVEELSVPDRGFAGMALRIFDPETDAWSVYWISSGSGVIGDPVVGPVGPEGCRLVAVDDFEGAPLHSTYEWFGIERDLVHWRQQLSRDGQAWDLDWEITFRRTDAEPRRQDLSYLPKVTGDFDFLDGTFRLHNRRLKERLTGCDAWIEFEHTSHARTHLGGAVSIDENVMPGFYTGLTFRSYDVAADEWAIHWIDNRTRRSVSRCAAGSSTASASSTATTCTREPRCASASSGTPVRRSRRGHRPSPRTAARRGRPTGR